MTQAAAIKKFDDHESAPIPQTLPHTERAPHCMAKTTLFALTRPGANGQIEFMSIYGLWAHDIAEAETYGAAAPLDHRFIRSGLCRQGVISQINFAVYDEKHIPPSVKTAWRRVDRIVVARQVNCHGNIIPTIPAAFVTSTGMIGRGYDILSAANLAKAVVVEPAHPWGLVAEQITRNTDMPFDQVGMWHRPRRYTFERAVRVTQITPVAGI